MSHLDDALQYFRDALGIKSNTQLDIEEASARARKNRFGTATVSHPAANVGSVAGNATVAHPAANVGEEAGTQKVTHPAANVSAYLKGKDVYLPVQMQPDTPDPRAQDWYKASQPIPSAPTVPQAQAPAADPFADPYGREPMLQKLIDAERKAGVPDPYAHGEKFGMLATGHHPQPMTAQEAQDYLDFLSPADHDDSDLPPAALVAMRRRR